MQLRFLTDPKKGKVAGIECAPQSTCTTENRPMGRFSVGARLLGRSLLFAGSFWSALRGECLLVRERHFLLVGLKEGDFERVTGSEI